jgi:CHAD domain-containing protein
VDRSYRWMAARYARKQAKQLGEQLPGIRKADDVECVHQARVASRRLRAALRVFRDCFPKKRWKRWRKEIRRITSELGEARDRDVQIEFLVDAMNHVVDPDHYPGIIRLLVQVESDREALQPEVLEAATRLHRSGVLGEMKDHAQKALSKGKDGRKGEPPSASDYACRRARKHVLKRLVELLALEDSLGDEGDIERHHAMRIAAKRLRYTLEIVSPVYEGRLDEIIKVVKRVQTLLGDIHDCDVWVEHLDEFAESQRQGILARFGTEGPFARLVPGIQHLRDDRLRRRAATFAELVKYWRTLGADGLWQRLETLVEAAAGPVEPAEPTETPPAAPSDATGRPEPEGSGAVPAESQQTQPSHAKAEAGRAGNGHPKPAKREPLPR